MKKRFIGILMTLILIFSVLVPPTPVQAKDKGYLVLTQTEEGGPWIAHENIASPISRGGAQISASKICEALGLEYEDTDSGFKISFEDKSLLFTDRSTSVKYTNGSKSVTKYPPVPTDYGDIYYGLLNYLSVHVQYYTRSQSEENGIYGYAGVICYSTAGNITRFPDLNNIYIVMDEETVSFAPEAQTNKKAPLVLIQKVKNGTWTYYEDLSEISENGNTMVKAMALAKELGLDYGYQTTNYSVLEVRKGIKELRLYRGEETYKQYNDINWTEKTAAEAMYISWPSGLDVVHYATFNYLVNVKYYSGDEVAAYHNMGYDSIICYSLGDKITSVPDVKKIVKAKSYPKYKDTITIGTVNFPKLSSFATSALKDSNWGFDLYEFGYTPLEYAMDEFSFHMRKNIMDMNIEDNAGDSAQLAVLDHSMQADINGDSTMSAMRLSKQDDHYEIYLSTRISKNPNKYQTDYSRIAQNVLKVYCTIISSTPEELNYAIYNSWEEDEVYGINKETWVTVGDCLVKYRSGDHAGIYMIKAK